MDFKFRNIAISGGVAVGTTTLMKNLKPYLEPYGWDFKSVGQFVREYLKENVMPVATLVSDEMDREIEKKTFETLKDSSNHVIEAWLAGFVSRDLSDVLRIYLYCSNEAIRIDRVVNRDKISVAQAKQFIRQRDTENIKKWKHVYGDYDFFDPKYYHLHIDTYSSGQMETVGKVLDLLGYNNKDIKITPNNNE